jgi:predicted outer membrane repeat protein
VNPIVLLAPPITVTNTDDAGPGSLRQAIIDAPTGSVIQFDPAIAGQTIVLTSGQLDINTALTIEGPVSAGMTISGGLNSRVFYVTHPGDLALRNLSLVNGNSVSQVTAAGGALYVSDAAKASLDHVLLANNQAVDGGAIYILDGADVTILNSTVSGNSASRRGGGIFSDGDVLTIRNTTIANNAAVDEGGGIVLPNEPVAYVRNTIIANNTGSSANCWVQDPAYFVQSGRNLSNDHSCGSDPSMLIADPVLGPLANNGGPTMTHALLSGSPAIDGGSACTETTDQRYVARNQGVTCDIGAFEFNDFGVVTITLGPNVAVNTKTGVATLTGTMRCSRPAAITLDVAMSQTQRITGRFTTVVQAAGQVGVPACGVTASSWSVALPPATGKFAAGEATGTATTSNTPSDFLQSSVTSVLKLFPVK